MAVNTHNYFETVEKYGVRNLSATMQRVHDLIVKATKGGIDWTTYQTYKKVMDMQFEGMELLLKPTVNTAQSKQEKKFKKEPITKNKVIEKAAPKKSVEQDEDGDYPRKIVKPLVKNKGVEFISPEVQFIKRFALLHYKEKTKEQILSFIRSLQKAIWERKIRKTSKHAATIMEIQRILVHDYRELEKQNKKGKEFKFKAADYRRYLKIAGAEHLLASIRFIKGYILLQGKELTKQKVNAFYERLNKVLASELIPPDDHYIKQIQLVKNSLKKYLESKSSSNDLDISEAQLSGLEGVLKACGCHFQPKEHKSFDLAGISRSEAPQRTIMNSLDIIKLKSNKLGFKGKWLAFIGNPSKGFTMMIFGKPKFGKSILASEFAGYLARNHGKVLYIAIEEGFEDTLKERLDDPEVAHENLDVSDYMPGSLAGYDFIFIDSVNRAGLNTKDLDELERKNPGKNFIYVFQTTKDGDFKGAMEFKHNVDVIVEVPERGTATQYGRYNQGGDMSIF